MKSSDLPHSPGKFCKGLGVHPWVEKLLYLNNKGSLIEISFEWLQAKPSSESHYFSDGVKRIDMILAYQEDTDKNRTNKKREVFEKLLTEQGLELETEYKTVSDWPHVK